MERIAIRVLIFLFTSLILVSCCINKRIDYNYDHSMLTEIQTVDYVDSVLTIQYSFEFSKVPKRNVFIFPDNILLKLYTLDNAEKSVYVGSIEPKFNFKETVVSSNDKHTFKVSYDVRKFKLDTSRPLLIYGAYYLTKLPEVPEKILDKIETIWIFYYDFGKEKDNASEEFELKE